MSVVSGTNGLVELTVCHPGGSVRLRAPDDVPLGELMCDFLECAGQPDGDWILSGEDEGDYPAGRTLAQLGVRDGAHLRMSERNNASGPALADSRAGDSAVVESGQASAPTEGAEEQACGVEELSLVEEQTGRVTLIDKPPASERAAGSKTPPVGVEKRALARRRGAAGRVTVERPDADGSDADATQQRPLRERTDRVLPPRLARVARCRVVLDALAGRTSDQPTAGGVSAIAHDPATFRRTVRVSPVERAREVWRESAYERRLVERESW